MPLTRAQKAQQSAVGLLALPEPLLLAVLQCLTAPADQRSVFSAARAHSRLHQAAVAVLSSVVVMGMDEQQTLNDLGFDMARIQQQRRLDGVLLYLSQHGQHVRNLSLGRFIDPVVLRQLPPTLQLHSLELKHLDVQLLPGDGHQGVLGYDGVSSLTQLRLNRATLCEGEEGLAAALAQLPGLRHLSIWDVRQSNYRVVPLSRDLLRQALQQLTHLELESVRVEGAADHASPALQPLQASSRLVDMRLHTFWTGSPGVLTPSMLSGATGLTRLELAGFTYEPGVLAGKTQLQHLNLMSKVPYGAVWMARLLSVLESLQQLTHITLWNALRPLEEQATPPAAAYSALTASTKLQHLELSGCTLPAGVWQHVLPAGRQLPHLTSLAAVGLQQPSGHAIPVPQGSCLVSCCPGLRSLSVRGPTYGPGVFAPLQGLSGLHTLLVTATAADSSRALREVCHTAGLRELDLDAPWAEEDEEEELLLLQSTQLRQLTRLHYIGPHNGGMLDREWVAQAPGDEPVWRQVLRHHLDSSDPAVAQAAAAALEAE